MILKKEIQRENIIIDSNIFIALWYKADQYHEISKQLFMKIIQQQIGDIYFTNYVLIEIMNFLLKKVSKDIVDVALDYLINTVNVKIIFVDKHMQTEINKSFAKYKVLSLTDCSLLLIAKELNINTIYSFDQGFDVISDIERKFS